VFFGWMWGVAGTLLAVPLLACFKIVCEHVEPLHPAGRFLA
jgi:predicted PurR-regulated permease PerM